ncbi:MAG: hypothetical protein JRH01_06490 [Deltaproteobacteria bacterium]|nr:hypothetical protein [Deltaproteobacteria bacterium]MBW2394998.1 hypothetical protein [Deltaproteobacteria bacterium]
MSRFRIFAALPLLAVLAAPAASQPDPPNRDTPQTPEPVATTSKLRTFLEQIDRVLVTRQRSLAPIAIEAGGTLTVSGIGAFEPGLESQRLLGLRIDLDAPGLEPEERVAYLDLHEVEALLRGMANLALVAAEEGGGLETEARILTLEGFGLGVWMHQGTTRYQIRGGAEGHIVGHVSRENFTKLKKQIETARDLLFNGAPTQ